MVVALINFSPIQTYLAQRATDILSERLHTKVKVANVRIGILNSLLIQGVYVEDQSKDTLLYAGEVSVRITDWFIFKNKPVIQYVGLENTYVNLNRGRDSKVWNYDFIADAFASPPKTNKKQSQPFEIDLKKVELENVRFHMHDQWIGEDMEYNIGSLLVNSDGLNIPKKLIDIKTISVSNTSIFINEYKGGRPPHLRPKYLDTFDVTPFNPDMWAVNVKKVDLKDCSFMLKADDNAPTPDEFDESHMDIRKINIDVTDVHIIGDTIRGDINNVTAEERCGIAIRKMKCKATVSPIASICENLYLATDHSELRNYYAMHYRHFPDFNHYLDSVTMVARLRDAKVDKRDIEFFAKEMKDFPDMKVAISGDGRGTVTNLSAKNLNVSDGRVALKGDLTMTGLPDIYSTYITFSEGEILTTGKGIIHYAPALHNNPNIAADSITFAFFSGNYKGYLEDFQVNGVLKTNMGTVGADVRMKMPGFSPADATYSGVVTTEQLQLGRLLRQPILGNISANEKISGTSFDPEVMQLRMDGLLTEFGVNGYNYHNIYTNGVLAKKEFKGKLIVDDPNLALTFDGGLNYADKLMKINATAHLLAANFREIKLTPDNFTAAADFDLNCTGSTIDDFYGNAKLFNIDLKRNGRKLAVDSLFMLSSGNDRNRHISLTSDAFTAEINGNYRLSALPASVQYYLSRYIPNYIKAPEKYAPDQDISFRVTTANVDSIFAITLPILRGFDNSVVSGSLNTNAKKLLLNATIPYGRVGNVHLRNVSILGEGDFNILGVNTTVGNIALGDSILHGGLSLTATVGSDSVLFNLATMSPDRASSFALNGRIFARSDTLTLNVFPSQFYLNRVKWHIAGGSSVVYSDKYLSVSGVNLSSGIQRVSLSSTPGPGSGLVVNTTNLDMAQLGDLFGLSSLQADGRINGNIVVSNTFTNTEISTNIRASGVKLGADTVGAINAVGRWDVMKKMLYIDPQTGIYRDHASVSASGQVALDSAAAEKINGAITFNNARVAWAAPFLTGLFSNIRGAVNGTVSVTGSNDKPVMEGKLTVSDVGFRLDYLGCYYTIPKATIGVTNQRISLGQIQVFDSYKNVALLSGYFSHELFNKMRMRLKVTTPKMELMNLARNENDLFYGKMIAGMDSFTIRGPFNNIRLNLYNGYPAAKSVLYIPSSSGGYVGAYSYVSFKTYGAEPEKTDRHTKDKISINLDANLNDLAEIHIVMDAATGDEIVATGKGNVQMDIPPSNDMRMSGLYTINQGYYTLTFQQVGIHRMFRLNQGSTIAFNGPFESTQIAVDAIYSVKARLYDLLSSGERMMIRDNEARDAQAPQVVNVMLHMKGPIYTPQLTFDLDLESKHTKGSLAYSKLLLINNDDRQKFDQVASLLLVGAFIPPEGMGQGALSGAINNVSQIISSTASSGLTNIVNRLIGDRNLNVAVKYTNYNYSDQSQQISGINRSQLKLGVTKNYLNDRLLISVGSTSDWGRPATANNAANSFNFAGDFRLQYLLAPASGLRLNAFHTSDYDLTRDRNIQRSGVGISWRRSFDNLDELFHAGRYARQQKEKQMKVIQAALDSTSKHEE